jgi:hypothetical protein
MSSCLVPTAFGNTPTDSTRVEKRRSQKRRTLPAAVCSVWRNLPSSGAAGIPADFPVSAIGGAKLSARRPSGALVSRRNSRSSVLEVRAAPVQLNQNSRHSPAILLLLFDVRFLNSLRGYANAPDYAGVWSESSGISSPLGRDRLRPFALRGR